MLNSNFWSYFPEFTLLTQCWVLSTAKYCFFSTAITLLLLQWPDWKVQTDKYPWQVANKYFSNITWDCLNSDRSCYHTTLLNYGVMFTIIQPQKDVCISLHRHHHEMIGNAVKLRKRLQIALSCKQHFPSSKSIPKTNVPYKVPKNPKTPHNHLRNHFLPLESYFRPLLLVG